MTKQTKSPETELTIEEKLRALYSLQLVDSEIDKIRTLRGELPLEVQDLEDEVAGLETRINNLKSEVSELEKSVVGKTNEITASQALIKKYEEQQNNVRNNREYDSLSKEIEFQTLHRHCVRFLREGGLIVHRPRAHPSRRGSGVESVGEIGAVQVGQILSRSSPGIAAQDER